MDQRDQAATELRQSYKRLFSCADGERVLQDLEARGFGSTCAFSADPLRAAFNAGRRSLWLHVRAMLGPETGR